MKNARLAKGSAQLLAVGVLMGAALLTGCDEHITVVRDPEIPIPRQATWAWRPAPPPPKNPVISRDVISRDRGGETVVRENDPNTETLRLQFKIGIEQTMASKGFVHVDDPKAADFLVDYHVGVHSHSVRYAEPGYYPVTVCGWAGCWETYRGYWGPPGYETIRYREGTFVFDLTKQNINRLAFRAEGYKELNHRTYSQQEVNDAMRHLLHDLKPGH